MMPLSVKENVKESTSISMCIRYHVPIKQSEATAGHHACAIQSVEICVGYKPTLSEPELSQRSSPRWWASPEKGATHGASGTEAVHEAPRSQQRGLQSGASNGRCWTGWSSKINWHRRRASTRIYIMPLRGRIVVYCLGPVVVGTGSQASREA